MIGISTNFSSWIAAFRLRTLPLALSSIGMGSFLAAYYGAFNIEVLMLSAVTTVFLQILSNLANDYGDTIHGADIEGRIGPKRAVQSGAIKPSSMRIAIGILTGLSLISGICLLYLALGFNWQSFLFFLILGVASIIAAITYTMGRNPYGYIGLGDISVMLFFGLVGVMGCFYLHTGVLIWNTVLPAMSCGFFSMAVLNLNNMRDIESDQQAGKMSIPVRIGIKKSVYYHWFLLASGILTSLIFVMINYGSWQQLWFLATIPLFIKNAMAVIKTEQPAQLDPYLKQMAITTLLFVIVFGTGLLVNP